MPMSSLRFSIALVCRLMLMAGVVFVAGSPAMAIAADLSSTMIHVSGGTGVGCHVVNVSTKPLDVTVSLLDTGTGATVETYTAMDLLPGVGTGVGTGPGDVHKNVRCVVSYRGPAKAVRAALVITSTAGFVPLTTLPIE